MTEQTEQYNERSDAELAELAKAGRSGAEEALVLRYGWLVRACARPLFLMGGDSEDLVQEGMMGLLAAVREYDGSRGVSFRTYAETCIRNRLRSAVKAASRGKHTPLNSYIPLDPALLDSTETEDASAADRRQGDPESLMIRREDMRERLDRLYQQLSPLEKRIFRLYLGGLSYGEIARVCGRPVKSVDNAVQRIRRKVERQN